MNYFSCLVFLGFLSIINIFILLSLTIFDYGKITSKQKIIFIRTGLIVIGTAPLIFFLTQLFSFHSFEIILPVKFINGFPGFSISTSSDKANLEAAFYIFIAYLAGCFFMLFRVLFSFIKATQQFEDSKRHYVQSQLVYLSENIQSPLSFGLPKAKIYFPANMHEKWTEREIEMCLAHEKIHINQNDILWKLLSLAVKAILFFVPWSYALHRRFELEMEIICDERTLLDTNSDIEEYGGLLLAMTSMQTQNLIFSNLTSPTLKRRFLAMKTKTKHRPLLASAFSVVLLFTGGATIAATNDVVMNKTLFKITSKIFVDKKLVSSPKIIAYTNQRASITLSNGRGENLKVDLIANEIFKNNIRINYDISYGSKNEKMHSKPVMLLELNKEGSIHMGSNTGHSYEMEVFAERQ